jgi:tRNA(fMet)-specific endonuclease VapC
MRWMLDTNACISLIKQASPKAIRRLRSRSVGQVGLSSISLAELEYGTAKSSRPEQSRQSLAEFLVPLDVAAFDADAAAIYGTLRSELERRGTPIGPLDTLIAAHALALGATLVTSNSREFRRVPDLSVEDWLDS